MTDMLNALAKAGVKTAATAVLAAAESANRRLAAQEAAARQARQTAAIKDIQGRIQTAQKRLLAGDQKAGAEYIRLRNLLPQEMRAKY